MIKEKFDLFSDFDSTLVKSVKRLVEILNEKHGTSHDWTQVKEYNLTDLFPTITHREIIEVFEREDFFDGLEFYNDALEILSEFCKVLNFKIATIGTEINLRNKKLYCAENIDFDYHFIKIEKDGVGKEEVDMSNGIFIDDHVDNLRSSNAPIKVLFKGGMETNWNQLDLNRSDDREFFVAEDWKDVEDILNFVLNNKLLEV